MIEVKTFSLEDMQRFQGFYCLQKISNVEQIQIAHNTPSGLVEFNKISAFSMPNGKIILAWTNPLVMAFFYNLVAISGEETEIVTINSIERVIEIYNKQTDSNFGIFSFSNSDVVLLPNVDWRCDSGRYGPRSFTPAISMDRQNLVLFEPILSITGIAHLFYIEYSGDSSLAHEYLNNADKPGTGRTFWECLKLIREWSIVNSEPFNNNELISQKASAFMNGLNFSNEELQSIDSQIPMQISKYILGDDNARQRPNDIFEMNDDIKNIMFRRLSSGTLSALEFLNAGMWDIEELIAIDRANLQNHRDKFAARIIEVETREDYIALQNKVFDNRELVLNKLQDGSF